MNEQVEILLVEDNEADVVLVKEALKDARVYNELHVARNGQAALDFLQAKNGLNPQGIKPGLILLDLYMPILGGLEVLAEIKKDSRLRTIPVVVMTSSQEEEDVVRAYELQANCYVTKPVDFEQLTKVVKTIENFWLTVVQLPTKR
jgi:chemotaxis family two-component system response regulator Rcp1